MAIILGGNGVDAAVAVGPNIVTNGLVFYTDPATSDSLITKNSVPLAQDIEVENVLNLVGTGSLDVSSASFIVPTYTTGSRGTLFTGKGDNTTNNTRLLFTPDINIGTTGTVDIWVKPVTSTNGRQWLYGLTSGTSNTVILNLALGTTLTIATDDRNYNSLLVSLSKNEWYNIVLVYNGANSKIYINGQEHPATSGATNTWWKGTTIPNYTINMLGASPDAGFSGDGYLGPLKLYNRNLSTQEVLQNYTAMKSRYTI